jgi:uncharacterized protein (DUF2267 family)
MISINTSNLECYAKYPLNVPPISLDDRPLDDKELYLAKGYVAIEHASSMVARAIKGEQGEDFEAQLREAMAEMRKYPDFFKLTGQVFDCPQDFVDVNNLPSFNLSNQSYSVNRTTNSMTIGIGSVVNLDGYSFYVGDNRVELIFGDSLNASTGYSDSNNNLAHALRELLWAAGYGKANFSDNSDLSNSMLTLLRKMGIDTNRDFRINDTVFEVKNGAVQTKEYTKIDSDLPLNPYAYLNAIVFKAYEQNLLPTDYMMSFENTISKYA